MRKKYILIAGLAGFAVWQAYRYRKVRDGILATQERMLMHEKLFIDHNLLPPTVGFERFEKINGVMHYTASQAELTAETAEAED